MSLLFLGVGVVGAATTVCSHIAPSVLDVRVVTKRVKDKRDKVDNWNLCVQSGRGVGCRINNVKTDDLANGDPDQIKTVIWQILKTSLETKVRKQRKYLASIIPDQNLDKAPIDDILVAWANALVQKAGHPFKATDIDTGFKDVNMYVALLDSILSTGVDSLGTDDLDKAIDVETNADLLGQGQIIQAEGILDAFYWMNWAFLATLLLEAAAM